MNQMDMIIFGQYGWPREAHSFKMIETENRKLILYYGGRIMPAVVLYNHNFISCSLANPVERGRKRTPAQLRQSMIRDCGEEAD